MKTQARYASCETVRPDSLCHDEVNGPAGEGRHQASPKHTITVVRLRRGTGIVRAQDRDPVWVERVGRPCQEVMSKMRDEWTLALSHFIPRKKVSGDGKEQYRGG